MDPALCHPASHPGLISAPSSRPQLLRVLPAVRPAQGLPLAEENRPVPGHTPLRRAACNQRRRGKDPVPFTSTRDNSEGRLHCSTPSVDDSAETAPTSSAQPASFPFPQVLTLSARPGTPHTLTSISQPAAQGTHPSWDCEPPLGLCPSFSTLRPAPFSWVTQLRLKKKTDLAKNIQLRSGGAAEGDTEAQTGKLICPVSELKHGSAEITT